MDWFKFKFEAPEISQSLIKVFSDPKSYITLALVVALLLASIYIARVKLTTKAMVQVSIAIALGTVLKMFTIMKMPMGGSVTLGSMIPIIFIAYVYGARVGYLTGVIFGIIDILLGATVVHPVQLVLDYIIAFGALGAAGYFKNSVSLGAIVSIGLRFICHVISGVVFFAAYAEGQNVLIYSILYNGTYLLPEAIIAMVILAMIPVKRIKTEMSRSLV